MKPLALLGVFLLITSGTWAYSNKCAKGPEYWCRDAATAKECGAVRHCEQTVWLENQTKKSSMTTSETAEMLCNVLVQASTALLAAKSRTIDSIKPYLRHDCTKLPNENNLIEHCELAVDIYLSDILRHLQSGMESNKICPLIQGHDAASSFVPKPKANDLKSNATCILCEFILHIVESMATANASEQELVQIFEKVCTELPETLRAECKTFVDAYGADIIALLVRDVDPAKACTLIKLCTKSNNVAFLTKPDLQTCGLCEYVSTYVKAGYPIENACSHFSTDNNIRQQCEILVHLYKPNICSQLPLCFDPELVKQPIETTVTSPECSVCKFVVNYIDTVVQNNKSEAAIEAALEKVCTILPHSLNATCVQFVVTFGPNLVPLIEKYVTADEVCAVLKLCHNGTQVQTSVELHQYVETKTVSTNSAECTLCEFILNYVDKAVGNNKSAAAINAALEKVCKILPASVRANCTSFVDKFGGIIAILLARNSTPAQVCDFLKLCNNGTQQVTPPESVPTIELSVLPPNSAECTLCEFILNYVEKAIGANKTAAAIDAALEKVCKILPASVRANCTSFVDKFGAIIAILLTRNSTAVQVCDFLKLCNNGTQQVTPLQSVPTIELSALPPNSAECTLCEFILNYVEKSIGANKTTAAIDAALEKVCKILPASVRANCTSFVDKFGPIIAILLIRNSTAVEVCDFLKLCNNGTQQVTPAESVPTIELSALTPNSAECTLCEFILNYVEKAIGANKTAAAIDAALEKVCKILPASVRANCTSFVDKFGAIIAILLTRNSTAVQVCDFLKLCNNGTQQVTPPESVPTIELSALPPNSAECTLCEFILNYVEKSIGANKTAAAIDAALEKVCKILPASVRANCTSFVDKFGAIIAILLTRNSTAVQVCDFLKLCNNGTQQVTPAECVPTIELSALPPNSAECTLCEFILNYVEKAIGANKTAAAIDAALEKVCKILPASVRANCTSFVDKFGAIIAILLTRNSTAVQVCDFLKLCNNGTQQVTPLQSVPTIELSALPPNSAECTLCEFILNYVEKSIGANKTTAAIDAALEKVCKILPASVRANCTSFVDKFGPIIAILLIRNSTAVEVCDFLKLCNNGTQQVTPAESVPTIELSALTPNSAECTLCEFILNYVEKAIGANRTAAAIDAALEKVCKILPASVRANCTSFVDKFGAIIAILLTRNSTAVQVCDFLKLCNNGTQQAPQKDTDYGLKIKELDLTSAECSVCKFVVSYIDTVIQNNKSEAAIDAALEKVCTILPHSLNGTCVNFVISYGPVLVQLIETYASADQVCAALKLCHNGTQEVASIKSAQISQVGQQSIKSPECSLCKLIVNYLELALLNNKSEAAIESALEKVCTIFPEAKKAECVTFVDKYGLKAVELLEKLGSPDLVCLALGLCIKNTPEMRPVRSVGSTECTLCKYIVSYVDAVIQTNKSEAAIDSALEKVCTILPHTIKTSCIQFVDTFGPVLVEYIAKYSTADKVCDALNICQNGTQEVAKPKTKIHVKPVKNAAECTLCKYVISFVNALLESNATEAEIEKALEGVCKILPATYHTSCDKFVTTYGPILPQLIAELDDPNVICDWLSLCQKSDNKFIEIPAVKSSKLKALPCTLCQYLVNYLDAIIQSNATEVHFEKELEKACTILPTTKVQSECKILVDLYGTDLVKLLIEFGNPKTVCQELGICDK